MFNPAYVRRDFPILKRQINGQPLVYLDNAATSQKPQSVIDAVVDYYSNHNANIHRGIHTLSQEATELVDDARASIAKFVKVRAEEIIFTRNATEGTNLLMYTWAEENLTSGDAVVVSGLEHHANLVPWQVLAAKKNLELRVVAFDKTGELILKADAPITQKGNLKIGALDQLLDDRVKLVAVTHASNVLGTIIDPKVILDALKKKHLKPLVILDASQSVPHFPVNLAKLGVDAAVFSGHKMLGPTGVGVFWGKTELLKKMPPFLYGGDMISEVNWDKSSWNELPFKFEAGTPNIAGIVGLGTAVEYLNNLGMDN
ncbi:MAG: Cysteine desulfurase, partial [Candidatus Gottesmanbacteria bacterium GW2011_GWA1_47_8]